MNHDTRLEVPEGIAKYYMREFIPSWQVHVEGPVPFGQMEPIRLSLHSLLVTTVDEADQEMFSQVRLLCERWRHEFDEDEWTVIHRQVINGN